MNEITKTDADAKKIGDLYHRAKRGAVESVRLLLQAGSRLAKKKAELGHGEWLPWIEANEDTLGFKEQAAQRLIRAASKYVVNDGFDDDRAVAISREIWGNTPKLPKPQRHDDLETQEDDPDDDGHHYPTDTTASVVRELEASQAHIADLEAARDGDQELEALRAAQRMIVGLESEVQDLKDENARLKARIEELEAALAAKSDDTPKRRGRPPGSKNKPKPIAAEVPVEAEATEPAHEEVRQPAAHELSTGDGLDIPEWLRRTA